MWCNWFLGYTILKCVYIFYSIFYGPEMKKKEIEPELI